MTALAVQQLIADARVPGLSMAVIHDRQATALTAVGVRNSLDRAAVDQQTIFAAASLSKPLFAYAVLQLDAGKLAFDTPLSLHVPDYVTDDPRAAAVTVRHVLSHTSGLPNWRSVDLPLKTYFPPGERFSYSGEGFVWLQRVVEAITGESLNTTLRRLIFEPLGMHRSSYVWQSAFEANYADPHDARGAAACHFPRVPSLKAFGRRPRCKPHRCDRPASETLNMSGSAACAAAAATLPVVVHDNNVEWHNSWRKTMTKALEVEISAFLNQYDEAFTTFDGGQIAALYCIPTITMRGDGSIHSFQSREEIARFFQGVADTYRGEGGKSGTMHDLEVVPIGERSALATVTWKNLRADGSVARQWRQSYNVVRFAEGWRILAATFHLSAAPG